MFRITTNSADDGIFMKLEGCLAGPWVRELDTHWRESTRALHGRRVLIDLRDVCHVDQAGRELIETMFHAGVRFVARGCDLPELLREIEATAVAQERN